MFGKKNTKNTPVEPAAMPHTTNINEQDVHVMPTKFLPEQHISSASPVKKIVLILALVFVVLGAGVYATYWFLDQQKNQSGNQNTNQSPNQNTNININTNTNSNTNTNQNINTNTNTNTNTNSNSNINTNTNTNTNTSPIEPASDTDNDELTRLEELLFKTNLNRPDTDKDGYRDGLEIQSLYDPLVPNHNLADSGLVTKYISADFGYTVLYPKEWLAQAMDDNTSKIVFLPDSETGEFFSIEAMPNQQNLTLAAYQATLDGSFENYNIGTTVAIRSADGLRVYTVRGDYIYALIYETTSQATDNFPTTFTMLLKSFAWQ